MLANRKQPSGFPHVERALTVCRNIETEGGVGGDGTSNLSRLVSDGKTHQAHGIIVDVVDEGDRN